MTTSPVLDVPAVVRLTGAQGTVAAAAHCLGFVPQHSLVMMCLKAPRGRVGPVMRIDLPPAGQTLPVEDFVRCARRYADAAVVLAYHDGPRPGCIDDLVRALRAARIDIQSVLSVGGGRIRASHSRSAFGKDVGIPVLTPEDDQMERLTAAEVLTDTRTLPDRQALADSIAPPKDPQRSGALLREWRPALAEARQQLAPLLTAGNPVLSLGLSRKADELLHAARAAYDQTGAVPVDIAAYLVAASAHPGCRDQLIARAVTAPESTIVAVWGAVAARCPDEDAAQICAVLAAAAYRFGRGALAQCALERTLAAEPAHRMALLLSAALANGLPPEELTVLARVPIPADEAAAGDRQTTGGKRGAGSRRRS